MDIPKYYGRTVLYERVTLPVSNHLHMLIDQTTNSEVIFPNEYQT